MRPTSLAAWVAIALLSGCARNVPPAATGAVAGHEHHAPHGGALVELGDEFAHLEFVYDPTLGQLTIYALDGEAEGSVRIAQPSIDLVLTSPAVKEPLRVEAVTSALTGEKPGDASQFMTTAPALRDQDRLAGHVTSVTLRGTVFKDVAFDVSTKRENPHERLAA